MKKNEKTKDQLMEEIQELRTLVAQLQASNTALQKAKKVLDAHRKNIQKLFDQAADFLFLVDFQGNMLKINTLALKKLGYTEKELVGHAMLNIFPSERHGDVQAMFERWMRGDKTAYSIPFLTKRDTLLPIETRCMKTRWNEQDVLFCISRDISEFKRMERMLRESEERYRTIFERAPIGIELATQNGKPLYVNKALQDMLGYSEAELRNMRFTDYTHPDDQKGSLGLIHALHEGKSDHLHTTRRYIRKEGTVFWGRTGVSAVRDANGNIKYFVTMVEDITEERHAHEAVLRKDKELRAQARELQEVNAALKVLLDHRDQEKKQLENNILVNAKKMILPYVDKLELATRGNDLAPYVDIVKTNIEELISPFARKLSFSHLALTPTEIQVADLIRHGRSSKEIARIFSVSLSAIHVHRYNIRKKLGLLKRKINLQSHLQSLVE